MNFSKLMTSSGELIENPTLVEATISWESKDGIAQAWSEGGRTLAAEMHGAQVVWIGAKGMKITGVEPIAEKVGTFRAMAWYIQF